MSSSVFFSSPSLENVSVDTSVEGGSVETPSPDTVVSSSIDSSYMDQILYLQKCSFFCDVSLVVLLIVLIFGVGWREWKH